jgi:hypothetical protein
MKIVLRMHINCQYTFFLEVDPGYGVSDLSFECNNLMHGKGSKNYILFFETGYDADDERTMQ